MTSDEATDRDQAVGQAVPTSASPAHRYRFDKTTAFMRASMPPPARVLDLGVHNPMSEAMERVGYEVLNTQGDLDDDYDQVRGSEVEAVTAFEILEHLVGPLNVLRAIEAPRLFATVPLALPLVRAYQNPDDAWDRHYHEFEPWQFDWLLEKAGWTTLRAELWKNPHSGGFFGVRPLIRRFHPRWYAVEAIRKTA